MCRDCKYFRLPERAIGWGVCTKLATIKIARADKQGNQSIVTSNNDEVIYFHETFGCIFIEPKTN